MSWFMRRPRIKEQPKQAPHHTSPISEKVLDNMKNKVRHSNSETKRRINKTKE